MNQIRINYKALQEDQRNANEIDAKLLRKAKGIFGSSAREELLWHFDKVLRHQAAVVAHREIKPALLYEPGRQGVLDALKLYEVGQTEGSFKDFAVPFIRQSMQAAKQKMNGSNPVLSQ